MAAVQLSDDFVTQVKLAAIKSHRSVPKQIEYWAKIGMETEEKKDMAAIKSEKFSHIVGRYAQTFEILSK